MKGSSKLGALMRLAPFGQGVPSVTAERLAEQALSGFFGQLKSAIEDVLQSGLTAEELGGRIEALRQIAAQVIAYQKGRAERYLWVLRACSGQLSQHGLRQIEVERARIQADIDLARAELAVLPAKLLTPAHDTV